MFQVPERYRVVSGPLKSSVFDGNNGLFLIPYKLRRLRCIASDGMGWEHVSVSTGLPRIPEWEEMCFIKATFWEDEDWVIQYHPAKSEYVNKHNLVLHLWKPQGIELPKPDKILV